MKVQFTDDTMDEEHSSGSRWVTRTGKIIAYSDDLLQVMVACFEDKTLYRVEYVDIEILEF